MAYELAHGRVQTWSLETHLVDHCNLRCANCCQVSPHVPEGFLDPDVLARDLARAKSALEPRVFKFTGGEPTLHPRLVECVRLAKESGIAPRVLVTTNGTRLAELPDAFFEAVDAIQVSWYPSAPLPERTLERIEERCREADVELNVRAFGKFQVLDAPSPLDDESARAIFRDCWLRHRCHLILRGRFYLCSRPPKLEPYLRARGVANDLASEDGVELEGPRLVERVLGMLEREQPLESCKRCLGASGPWEPHRQLKASELRG